VGLGRYQILPDAARRIGTQTLFRDLAIGTPLAA
jgi:hypothetical protein